MNILKKDVKYALKSKKTSLYYSFKNKKWVHNFDLSTLYGYYNPIKYIAKWYISFKYEPTRFSKIIFMKARFDVNV